MRSEKECDRKAHNSCDTEQRSASQPASSVASGTHCIRYGAMKAFKKGVEFSDHKKGRPEEKTEMER